MSGDDEAARLDLYRGLEEVLGAARAGTLMEHLPPAGWRDLATKSDLATLKHELEGTIHRELVQQTRFYVMVMVAWGSVVVAAAFAIGRGT
jgi:hypothetical protein